MKYSHNKYKKSINKIHNLKTDNNNHAVFW